MSTLAKFRQLVFLFMLCALMAPGYARALDALPDIPPSDGKSDKKDKDTDKVDNKKDKSDDKDAKKDDADSKNKEENDSDTDKKGKKKHKAKMNKVEDVDDVKPAEHKSANTPGDDLPGDSRIKLMLYDESDVYTVTTRYGYQTNIVFAPQEEIELISVGDRSLWQIIPNGNRMFIRPMEEDVITNMTVLTNKHSYQFDLKSLAPEKSGNIYVARFVYEQPKRPAPPLMDTLPPGYALAPGLPGMPEPPPAGAPFGIGPSVPSQSQIAANTGPAPSATPLPPMNVGAPLNPANTGYSEALHAGAIKSYPNYSYTYAGPDEVAPLQVYDDGRSTYLKYRDVSKLAPSVFSVDKAGHETPVNYAIKGDFVVIDAVAGELELKSGGNVIHVFNEVLNPG